VIELKLYTYVSGLQQHPELEQRFCTQLPRMGWEEHWMESAMNSKPLILQRWVSI